MAIARSKRCSYSSSAALSRPGYYPPDCLTVWLTRWLIVCLTVWLTSCFTIYSCAVHCIVHSILVCVLHSIAHVLSYFAFQLLAESGSECSQSDKADELQWKEYEEAFEVPVVLRSSFSLICCNRYRTNDPRYFEYQVASSISEHRSVGTALRVHNPIHRRTRSSML